ncbi:MAG: aminoglycoside phosphotransferase family protein [Rhodobacteraceae bacterium]|nr:aminoglycoside phosphotransferase family protein [Paracoccaceae bacterium]
MSLPQSFPLVQRYALLGDCEGAALLAEADAQIAADAEVRRLLSLPGAVVTTDLQTRLRNGKLRIKSILWTVQVPMRSSPGLMARSVSFRPDGAQWFGLGDDPTLVFADLLHMPDTRILRYVPGRRATLLLGSGEDRLIRKIKKKERLASASLRHLCIEKAVADRPFDVPQMIADGDDLCLGLCPGATLDAGTATAGSLAALGQMVAQLHGCAVLDAPAADLPDDPLPWLAAAMPGLASRWQGLADALARESAPAVALCHGDLSLAQVLLHQDDGRERMTLLDFDRAGAGDPARDLATLLCALQDAGLPDRCAAEATVIAGYSSLTALPANLPYARAKAELEQMRHLIRKGMAPSRRIMAGLTGAEAALSS